MLKMPLGYSTMTGSMSSRCWGPEKVTGFIMSEALCTVYSSDALLERGIYRAVAMACAQS